MKRKPLVLRCKELKPKRLRFGEKNKCSSFCLHEPKSLFETSLLVVKASSSAIRREKIRLNTKLEKTKDELKATKDKMRKTLFSVDTIRNNDKLCKHYSGFPNFFTTFPILLHHIVFLQFVTWKDAHRNIYYRLSSKGAVIKFASGSESESSQALISYNL